MLFLGSLNTLKQDGTLYDFKQSTDDILWQVLITKRSDAALQRLSRLVLLLRKRLPGLGPCSLTHELPIS